MQSIMLLLMVATLTVGIVNCSGHYWYSPIVATSLGVHLSSEANNTILHNSIMRIIDDDMTIGLMCYPSYFTIDEKVVLVYFDKNNTEHRSIQELPCRVSYAELGHKVAVPQCSGSDKYALQIGHVDAKSNHSYVLAELCFVSNSSDEDQLHYGRSRLSNLRDDDRQTPIQNVTLREFRYDSIGHNSFRNNSDVLELQDLIFDDLNSDALWHTSLTTRSYDVWERFLWNSHMLGLDYMTITSAKMSETLAAVVEDLTERMTNLTEPSVVELYTGFLDELELHGAVAGVNVTKVPKFVWIVAREMSADEKGIAYVVPNGDHSVNKDLCQNRCDDIVYCCYVHELAEHVGIIKLILGLTSESK